MIGLIVVAIATGATMYWVTRPRKIVIREIVTPRAATDAQLLRFRAQLQFAQEMLLMNRVLLIGGLVVLIATAEWAAVSTRVRGSILAAEFALGLALWPVVVVVELRAERVKQRLDQLEPIFPAEDGSDANNFRREDG